MATDLVANWLDALSRQGKSNHTISAYRRAILHFSRWNQQTYGVEFDITAVMSDDLRDWLVYQQIVEKVAPRTINQRLVGVSRFFKWARSAGLITNNPASDTRLLPLETRQPHGISDEDLQQLLNAAHQGRQLRDIAMIELLAGTGLRVGELLQLQIGDIEINEHSGNMTVRHNKNHSGRKIPLTRAIRRALSQYLSVHPEKDDPQAPLWIGSNGKLQHRSSVLRILNKYALRAGLSNIHPHAIRHNFAIRYLKHNPEDLRGLASILGHSSLDTLVIYTGAASDDLTARIEKLDTTTPDLST